MKRSLLNIFYAQIAARVITLFLVAKNVFLWKVSLVFFHFCPRLVCFSQETFGSHHLLFVHPE